VLGSVVGRPAVCDDLDGMLHGVLPCVGHRVMVPPSGGGGAYLAVGDRFAGYKDWCTDAQVLLTVA
jgi:hypothetical protein